MAEQGHTPTPWWADDKAIEARGGHIAHVDANWPDEQPDANAAFIVRACNCHDELVARLRDCRKAIASCAEDAFGFGHCSKGQWPLQSELLHYIDAAITSAAPADSGGG